MWRVKGHYWAGRDAKEACHFNNRPAERLQALLPGGSVMYRGVLEHTATFSQANLSKTPIAARPPQVTSHRYLSYRASYTCTWWWCGRFCLRWLVAMCVVCNKSQPPGAAGLSDSREAENSGLSLAYFHPVQSCVWGPLSLTAFGQMKIRRCASALSRASSSGKSPHHSVFHIPLPLVPRFLWTSLAHTHLWLYLTPHCPRIKMTTNFQWNTTEEMTGVRKYKSPLSTAFITLFTHVSDQKMDFYTPLLKPKLWNGHRSPGCFSSLSPSSICQASRILGHPL